MVTRSSIVSYDVPVTSISQPSMISPKHDIGREYKRAASATATSTGSAAS